MLMTFLINEYYDYEADVLNKQFHSLSGGSRVLPLGLVSRHQTLAVAYILLFLSGAIGLVLYLYFKTGPLTIPFGFLAIFIGYFYTAKPLQLCYRGFGEVAILFSCGWLATIVGYYLQTGHIGMVATLASLPGAFSVFLVILANEFPDIPSDSLAGKRNLAVRLGKEKSTLLYCLLLVLTYLGIIAIIFFGVPKISARFSLVLLPFIVWNILSLRKEGGSDEIKNLEAVSLRTMLLDHLITFIYIATFIIVGLGEASFSSLAIIIALGVIMLFLEGLSIVASNIIRKLGSSPASDELS
jgi:1,4-dihydroxy-2-naphthoate octaprenyltransferase